MFPLSAGMTLAVWPLTPLTKNRKTFKPGHALGRARITLAVFLVPVIYFTSSFGVNATPKSTDVLSMIQLLRFWRPRASPAVVDDHLKNGYFCVLFIQMPPLARLNTSCWCAWCFAEPVEPNLNELRGFFTTRWVQSFRDKEYEAI